MGKGRAVAPRFGTIIGVEGPSGAGKDYYIGQHRTENEMEMLRQGMPRVMVPAFGAWTSSVQEYQAISYAILFQQRVWSNRFLLSRWVYRAFEDNQGLAYNWYDQMYKSWLDMCSLAWNEATRRCPQVEPYAYPICTLHVLLPSLHTLNKRRAKAHKELQREYPFDAETELGLYTEMAEKLHENPFAGLTVHLH